MTKTIIIAAAFAAAFAAQSASAASPVTTQDVNGQTVQQIAISTSGYNLSNSNDAKTLARVIRTAASRICGGTPDAQDLQSISQYRACTTKAIAGAAEQVDSPALYATLNVAPTKTRLAFLGRS